MFIFFFIFIIQLVVSIDTTKFKDITVYEIQVASYFSGELTLFVVSLCRYIHARKQNKKSPDSFGKEEINKREMYFVFFSVVLGALVLVVVGFTVLLFSAVAFM